MYFAVLATVVGEAYEELMLRAQFGEPYDA